MDEREYEADEYRENGAGTLWLPPSVQDNQYQEIQASFPGYPDDFAPVRESHKRIEAVWSLMYPMQLGGLCVKGSAVERQTVSGDIQTVFDLQIMRVTPYGVVEPGGYTREELTALRDQMSFILEDSKVG